MIRKFAARVASFSIAYGAIMGHSTRPVGTNDASLGGMSIRAWIPFSMLVSFAMGSLELGCAEQRPLYAGDEFETTAAPAPPATTSGTVDAAPETSTIVNDAGTPEAPPPAPDAAPPPVKKMSFFVTSVGSANGGNLGGLVGADTICQSLATAAGVGNRTWQAYLSTDVADGVEVNAKDRIGTGPWYNAKDELIANDVAALHANGIVDTKMLDEKGVLVVAPVLTSTNADGTAATENCMNWTAVGDGNTMRVGYTNASSSGSLDDAWNTDPTPVTGCSAANFAAMNLGRFYCFAIN